MSEFPTGPFTIAAQGTTFTYDMGDVFWRGSEMDDDEDELEYPFVAFDWDGRGEVREEREPLNPLVEQELIGETGSTDVERTNESPQSDTVVIQVSGFAEADDNGVFPQTRVNQIAGQMWDWVTGPGHGALNSVGPSGERPCLIKPTSTPTPSPGLDTYRVQFSVEVQYTMTWTEVTENVEDEDVDVTTDQP